MSIQIEETTFSLYTIYTSNNCWYVWLICGCVVIGEFVVFLWFFCDLRILLWFVNLLWLVGSWWFPDLLLWFASLLWFANFLLWFVGFVVICRFVMICGFVSSLTWLILMLQAYVSEVSNANHQALGVSIVWSLFLYSFLLVFVGSGQLLLNCVSNNFKKCLEQAVSKYVRPQDSTILKESKEVYIPRPYMYIMHVFLWTDRYQLGTWSHLGSCFRRVSFSGNLHLELHNCTFIIHLFFL
jgi:hypothetical protein